MDLRILCVLAFFILAASCDLLKTINKKNAKLPSCEVCKLLVKSFQKGMERTSRGNFAGGDTAWEEEKLGSYYRSEVRLVEIQERLCFDAEEAEAQCYAMAEEAESHIENWWFKKRDSDPNLEEYLCLTAMNLCCESGRYGPSCEECPGYPNSICSGNGKCEGSGTQSGNGQCVCNAGYKGTLCELCAVNYFNVNENDDKVLCSPCHISCRSVCSDGSPSGCKDCKSGWRMEAAAGCVDIDECKVLENVCKSNEICINNKGSFTCRDVTHLRKKDPGKWVRYVTYVGFFIATGVFFRKNLILGSMIGVIAAIYVSTSEIVMSDHIDLSKLGFNPWFRRS